MTGSLASKDPITSTQSTDILNRCPARRPISRCGFGHDGELGRAETLEVQEGIWK